MSHLFPKYSLNPRQQPQKATRREKSGLGLLASVSRSYSPAKQQNQRLAAKASRKKKTLRFASVLDQTRRFGKARIEKKKRIQPLLAWERKQSRLCRTKKKDSNFFLPRNLMVASGASTAEEMVRRYRAIFRSFFSAIQCSMM